MGIFLLGVFFVCAHGYAVLIVCAFLYGDFFLLGVFLVGAGLNEI